jgi:hypothetical protein
LTSTALGEPLVGGRSDALKLQVSTMSEPA